MCSFSFVVTISPNSGSYIVSVDCSKSCSNDGTVTVTLQCKITGSGSDKDCNAANFNTTICDYVVLRDKQYVCDEVKRNYTNIVGDINKVVKECDTVCPINRASGKWLELKMPEIYLKDYVTPGACAC